MKSLWIPRFNPIVMILTGLNWTKAGSCVMKVQKPRSDLVMGFTNFEIPPLRPATLGLDVRLRGKAAALLPILVLPSTDLLARRPILNSAFLGVNLSKSFTTALMTCVCTHRNVVKM